MVIKPEPALVFSHHLSLPTRYCQGGVGRGLLELPGRGQGHQHSRLSRGMVTACSVEGCVIKTLFRHKGPPEHGAI